MQIGIDFDNTIVCYDELFHVVALERSLIPDDLPKTKLAVRDFLRATNNEASWTEMQGYVYGARIDEAVPYPGAIDVISTALGRGHNISIVSHKTKYPFAGPKFDLHASARKWLDIHLVPHTKSLPVSFAAYFELSKPEKLARIASCQCDLFIDDLPEILLDSEFPSHASSLLFDPENLHSNTAPDLQRADSWQAIQSYLQDK